MPIMQQQYCGTYGNAFMAEDEIKLVVNILRRFRAIHVGEDIFDGLVFFTDEEEQLFHRLTEVGGVAIALDGGNG